MTIGKKVLTSLVLISLASTLQAADGVNESDLFGGSDDIGSSNNSEESLFGADDNDTLFSVNEDEGIDLAQEFLAGSERYALNGDFALSASSSRSQYGSLSATTADSVKADGTLTFDARPSASLRGLLKMDYSLDQDASDVTMREAFVDYSIADQWYIRGGRQVMHWGVGYFFKPADLVNSDVIDPTDPEAARTGTDALKLQYPTGNDNYYAYLIPVTGTGNQNVAIKGEWLVASNEVTVGLLSRENGHNSMALTAYLPSNDLNLFAEYVLHHGVQTLAIDSLGSTSDRSDEWLSQSTAGMSYSYTDNDDYKISLTGQYYYNGLGYDNALWQSNSSAWKALAATGSVETSLFGREYWGASTRWSSILQSDYTLSYAYLANTDDLSQRHSVSMSYVYSDDISAKVTLTKVTGDSLGQYTSRGTGYANSVQLTLMSRDF